MADVIIRGIELPKEGVYTCELSVLDESTALLTIYTPIDKPQRSYKFAFLPEGHGKLGDLDSLDRFIHEKETKAAAEEFYLGKAWYRTFRQIVRLMQTIVPPEGGTDNG